MHLFDLPLLCIRNLGEPLALQRVILLQLRGVARVQVARSVWVSHGDIVAAVWANISPPVGIQVFTGLLVYILAKGERKGKIRTFTC